MRSTTVALAAALLMLAGCLPAAPAPAADGGLRPTVPPAAPLSTATETAASPVVASPVPTGPAAVAPVPSPLPSPARVAASPTVVAASPAAASVATQADGSHHPGPYFLGRADAPVTVEEYSDFQ